MNIAAISCFILLIGMQLAKAADDNSVKLDPTTRSSLNEQNQIIFDKVDFNNNTLGEMVIKLNSMIQNQAGNQKELTVVLDLNGKTEPEINKILDRKVINWFPIKNIQLWELLAYISQLTSCSYQTKGHYIVLTPSSIYNKDMSDVDMMLHPSRH